MRKELSCVSTGYLPRPQVPYHPQPKQKGFDSMKSTGIVRKVDELGRIVLPIELRRTLDIAEKDCLEIYMDGPSIVLKKYQRVQAYP